jgi:hypothetical protein
VVHSVKPIFSLNLTDGEHHRHFAVERAPNLGWSIRDESDTDVIRQATFDDWHRVELAIRGFTAEAAVLARHGWQKTD